MVLKSATNVNACECWHVSNFRKHKFTLCMKGKERKDGRKEGMEGEEGEEGVGFLPFFPFFPFSDNKECKEVYETCPNIFWIRVNSCHSRINHH